MDVSQPAVPVLQADSSPGMAPSAVDPIDPRISYPSYKPFDEFIDLEALRELDGFIRARLEQRLGAEQDRRFYTGPFVLGGGGPDRPGTRMIYLARSTRPDAYYDLDNPEVWRPTAEADEFAPLMTFIGSLPFSRTARMLIIYDDVARPVTAHRDHDRTGTCHEFVWFRTNLDKPFYMLNPQSGEKRYVESHSAWFDTVNQFHGGDGCDGLSFSIRVDGVFTDEFRRRIPRPRTNPASTPSLWAALG